MKFFFCCCCILCIYAYTESVHRNIARDIFPKRQLLLCVAYCFYHYLGFTISFLDLGYPTEQEKPLTTSGSMVYSSSNPPQYFNSNPARSSDGEGVKCDSERQVPGEEKSKG